MYRFSKNFYPHIDSSLKKYVAKLPREVYKDPQLQKILIASIPLVEDTFGVSLAPTYSFLRKYATGDVLFPHRDRPACEYSVTLCIDTNCDWPLFFQYPNKPDVSSFITYPGDAILYKGAEVRHWRKTLETQNSYQHQLFLHYVDINGENSDQAYDAYMDLSKGIAKPGAGGKNAKARPSGATKTIRAYHAFADMSNKCKHHRSSETKVKNDSQYNLSYTEV